MSHLNLSFELSEINRNFRIKISTPSNRRGRLVGRSGLILEVGLPYAEHIMRRVYSAKGDVVRVKCHRGTIISFYVK